MRSRKRLGYYLLLNVIVSAITTWLVLTLWIRTNPLTDPAAGLTSGLPAGSNQDSSQTQPLAQAAGQLEISNIFGAGDLGSERIEIRNVGETKLLLAGWRLIDQQGTEFVFPDLFEIYQGGAVTVHTQSGVNSVYELFWGMDEPVWEVGEAATLFDQDGNPQAAYTVP
ncbi:MAG: lamin tail domain-containing protein [Chloroflexi bacterium]|nr:lamin tail domain-containing protein [Chloroflexota bacterium]